MMTTFLVALAAGLASALMFSSLVSGALVSLLLFYLSPLPLMVAALGWGPATALIAGLLAAAGLMSMFGFVYMAAFALTVALPAWWLGNLALLARPVSEDERLAGLSPALDWYPTGRILVWIAGFAILTTVSALLTLGTDHAAISAALRRGLLRVLAAGTDGVRSPEGEKFIDFLVALAPGAATLIAMLTLTFNLWLSAKITIMSARLKRPWPDLRTTTMPNIVLAVLAVAFALCLVGGMVGMIAQIITSALLMSYAVTGFAVLHTLTQSFSGRTVVLTASYAATVFIGWPLIGIMGLGIADAIFGIRQTYWTKRGLPTQPS